MNEPADTEPIGVDADAPPTGANVRDVEKLLDETEAAVLNAQNASINPGQRGPSIADPIPFQLDNLHRDDASESTHSLKLLNDVELDLRIELGRTQMRLEDILRLRGGSVVSLDKLAGDPVDIYVNGRLIAHGEVLVMNDNFCIRVVELIGVSGSASAAAETQ